MNLAPNGVSLSWDVDPGIVSGEAAACGYLDSSNSTLRRAPCSSSFSFLCMSNREWGGLGRSRTGLEAVDLRLCVAWWPPRLLSGFAGGFRIVRLLPQNPFPCPQSRRRPCST